MIANLLFVLTPDSSWPFEATFCLIAISAVMVIFAALLRSAKPRLSTFGIASFGMVTGCSLAFPIFVALAAYATLFMSSPLRLKGA